MPVTREKRSSLSLFVAWKMSKFLTSSFSSVESVRKR